MLDKRSRLLLKRLIEQYIEEGQPVGSRSLSKLSGLELSPATIRNVMADLEELGFVSSPHTSAGRVPTPRGYRFFVDTLMTVRPLEAEQAELIEAGNVLNQRFAGLSFEQARASLRGELSALRQEMADLMEAAVQAGAEEVERSDPVVISGERNLLGVNDLAADMDKLRALFDLFDHKARLLQLLDVSGRSQGVQIYIGGEWQLVPLEELRMGGG